MKRPSFRIKRLYLNITLAFIFHFLKKILILEKSSREIALPIAAGELPAVTATCMNTVVGGSVR